MTTVRALLSLLLFLIALAPRPALAWNVRICVDIDVDLDQAAGGDYWTNNVVHKSARGFRYEIRNWSTHAVLYSGHLAEGGSWPGCTPQQSITGSIYVRTYPDGEVNGLSFVHEDATAVDSLGFSPIADGTIVKTVSYADEAYAQLVMVSYALWKYDGSVTGETITVDHDATSCCYTGGNNIHLQPTVDGKYKVLHELGHAMAHWYAPTPTADLPATESTACNGGGPFDKMFQSKAISQGLADFLPLVTWNDPTQSDCDHRSGEDANVDLAGGIDYPAGTMIPCAGDPDAAAPDYTDGRDWLDDVYGSAGTCGAWPDQLNGRSTRYDWHQYLWGLYSPGAGSPGDGLSREQIYTILAGADPDTWDVDGDGSGSDDPWIRWNTAAVLLGGDILDAHLAHLDKVNH